ncbi:MAG: hypothetical protein IJO49_06215, partial [Clostridia bacterium]|nr:hypothetical protein [Clostridia bacterium]
LPEVTAINLPISHLLPFSLAPIVVILSYFYYFVNTYNDIFFNFLLNFYKRFLLFPMQNSGKNQ